MNFRVAYFVLAIAGAIIPYAFFLQHFDSEGLAPAGFLRAAFANGVAGGFSADLLISSLVFWIVMFRQRITRRGPPPVPFMLINVLVGLSCALPAWLYARGFRESKQ